MAQIQKRVRDLTEATTVADTDNMMIDGAGMSVSKRISIVNFFKELREKLGINQLNNDLMAAQLMLNGAIKIIPLTKKQNVVVGSGQTIAFNFQTPEGYTLLSAIAFTNHGSTMCVSTMSYPPNFHVPYTATSVQSAEEFTLTLVYIKTGLL